MIKSLSVKTIRQIEHDMFNPRQITLRYFNLFRLEKINSPTPNEKKINPTL